MLVTDAEATSHSGSEEAWGPEGTPTGMAGMYRLIRGAGQEAARRAALLAAIRARRAGITVSVVYPTTGPTWPSPTSWPRPAAAVSAACASR